MWSGRILQVSISRGRIRNNESETHHAQSTTTNLLCVALLLRPGGDRGGATGGADGRSMLVRNFEDRAPAVGARVPDLPVYDRDGQKSRLPALLDGRVTVLILGCLT